MCVQGERQGKEGQLQNLLRPKWNDKDVTLPFSGVSISCHFCTYLINRIIRIINISLSSWNTRKESEEEEEANFQFISYPSWLFLFLCQSWLYIYLIFTFLHSNHQHIETLFQQLTLTFKTFQITSYLSTYQSSLRKKNDLTFFFFFIPFHSASVVFIE